MLDYRVWGITGLIFLIAAAFSAMFAIGTLISWTIMSINYAQHHKKA